MILSGLPAPMFWPQKCAEVCGKLGYEIPTHIRDQLSKWDIERYEALLKEHSGRISEAKEMAAKPISAEAAPPSMVSMVAQATAKEDAQTMQKPQSTEDSLNKKMSIMPIEPAADLSEEDREFADSFDDMRI